MGNKTSKDFDQDEIFDSFEAEFRSRKPVKRDGNRQTLIFLLLVICVAGGLFFLNARKQPQELLPVPTQTQSSLAFTKDVLESTLQPPIQDTLESETTAVQQNSPYETQQTVIFPIETNHIVTEPTLSVSQPDINVNVQTTLNAPIINVSQPDIHVNVQTTLNAPIVNVSQPDINVNVQTTLNAPIVNVSQPDINVNVQTTLNAPIINVSQPDIHVNVQTTLNAPIVNVSQPDINVNVQTTVIVNVPEQNVNPQFSVNVDSAETLSLLQRILDFFSGVDRSAMEQPPTSTLDTPDAERMARTETNQDWSAAKSLPTEKYSASPNGTQTALAAENGNPLSLSQATQMWAKSPTFALAVRDEPTVVGISTNSARMTATAIPTIPVLSSQTMRSPTPASTRYVPPVSVRTPTRSSVVTFRDQKSVGLETADEQNNPLQLPDTGLGDSLNLPVLIFGVLGLLMILIIVRMFRTRK